MNTIKISVRDLVKYACRNGGLSRGTTYSDLSGSDDTPNSLHSQTIAAIIKKDRKAKHLPEYWMKHTYNADPITLEIRGRADLISILSEDDLRITEIKTIIGGSGKVPDQADPLHTAQAKIYGYMYFLESERTFKEITITIRYVFSPAYAIKDFSETYSGTDLENFFDETCRRLTEFTHSITNYHDLRNQTIRDMKFPYPDLRQGQKEFMNAVLESVKSKDPLYAQAPTGTGKTISVLYPAIKAIPSNFSDYIFYLTAKTSTQLSACEALDDMRDQGLFIKSIRLTAKEKICLRKDIYCDMESCEYAVSYYNNNHKAMTELFGYNSIDSEVLQNTARKHRVCPFEIGLDISMFCDVIICDYNYVFDPRIKLARFFLEDVYRYVFLVDEAHNLPSRCNEMFSASLSPKVFDGITDFLSFYSDELRNVITSLLNYFDKSLQYLDSVNEDLVSFDSKIERTYLVKVDDVCASRKAPQELIELCSRFTDEARPVLDSLNRYEKKKPLLDVFFEIRFFEKAGNEFFNGDYITLLSKEKNRPVISLRCLNASDKLTSFHNGKNSTVYFSATMSPQEYYVPLFSGKPGSFDLKRKILPSPFPPENLWVGVFSAVSTKYNNRPYSLEDISSAIFSAVSVKAGNYLVYCPSFEYQRMIIGSFMSFLERQVNKPQLKVIGQSRGMSEKERNEFLDSFLATRNEFLVGFAVLGGVFGEGIDLTGESLSGVVLVGVGLPAKSFEQDILMDYFDNSFGKGFDYAYKYPGFNKILQAAGRVIRTETDKGFILLVDERYARQDYKELFPVEWDPVYVSSAEEISKELNGFFDIRS